jgi:hypothetical protein
MPDWKHAGAVYNRCRTIARTGDPSKEGATMKIQFVEVVECVDATESLCLDALENRLQARLSGRIRGLRVLLRDSGIVLRGLARTYHAKQIAQHAIMAETTVPILANEIEVA